MNQVFLGNKAKGRFSKQSLQENKAHQTFFIPWYANKHVKEEPNSSETMLKAQSFVCVKRDAESYSKSS